MESGVTPFVFGGENSALAGTPRDILLIPVGSQTVGPGWVNLERLHPEYAATVAGMDELRRLAAKRDEAALAFWHQYVWDGYSHEFRS